MNPYLSVIIPAFNESERIGKTLENVNKYLKQQSYDYEIIVVDDGSKDSTRNLVENLCSIIKNIEIISLPNNQGKGAAVKTGMLSAKGEVRLFMDADGSTGIREIERLLPFLSKGYDIVVGSRLVVGAVKKVKQNFTREALGWVYRKIVRVLINTDIKDTQNGFKLLSKTAAEKIFNDLQTKGWSFDIEIIMLANKMGYKIKELPIIWSNDKRSRMRFIQMFGMLLDTLNISRKYSRYVI